MKTPWFLVEDVRFLFDTRKIALTVSFPLEILKDERKDELSVAMLLELSKFMDHVKENITDYRKMTDRIRGAF